MTPQASGKAPPTAGSREAAEPTDVTHASGGADGHGLELILDQVLTSPGHRGAATH
jgi:hypothetical protein